MATREKYEYRVISYIDDPVRFEPINFALILQNTNSKKFSFVSTTNSTTKINSLLTTTTQRKLFKYVVNYLSFFIDEQRKQGSLSALFKSLTELDIPEIHVSESKPALTDDDQWLLNKLADVYIGHQFLAVDESGSNLILPKEFAQNVLTQNSVPQTHFKANYKVQPEPAVKLKVRVDYIYSNEQKLEVINSAPITLTSTADWYYRMRSLGESDKYGHRITILGNSKSEANKDSTLVQMVNSLRSSNSNFKFIDVSAPDASVAFEQQAVETMKNKSSEDDLKLLLA